MRRRAFVTLLGGIFVFLCISAKTQEGYYGVAHDKWHQGFYSFRAEGHFGIAGNPAAADKSWHDSCQQSAARGVTAFHQFRDRALGQ